MVQAPHKSFQTGGPVPGRWAPRMLGFVGQWGLISGEPEGCGNELSPTRSAQKIINQLGNPGTETAIWKKPGLNPSADLGEPPGEVEGNWSSSWGYRHRWQPFGGAGSTTWTLVLECHFVILLAYSCYNPDLTNKPIRTSTGIPSAKQKPRQRYRPTLRPLKPAVTLEPALATPGPLAHIPVVKT